MTKIGHVLLFTTLIILLVGAVNATEASDNSTISTYDATEVVDNTQTVSLKNTVLEENNANYLKNDESSKYNNDYQHIKKKNTNDTGVKEDSMKVSSWNQLYDAVVDEESATTDTTIVLGEGTYTTFNAIIWNNTNMVLTIEGNGQTIDGNSSQVFDIRAGSSLVLKNITIKNAKFDYGGAITNAGKLTIINSTLKDNEAKYGAAVYNTGELTVINSTLENNAALYNGGAIYSKGTLTITESKFNNNKVTTSKNAADNAYGGGAIYSIGPLSIDKSLFTDNVVAYDDSGNDLGYGGAVTVFNTIDDVSITNSNFIENEAGGAGAIEVYDPQNRDEGSVLIDSNNFIRNRAYQGGSLSLEHSAIVNNNNFTENMLYDKNIDIQLFGAAITFYDTEYEKTYTLTLSDNIFKDNNAGQGDGGTIFIDEGMMLDSKNNIYENNKAAFGGAILNYGNATLTNDTFTNNTALYNGGAINSQGTLTVTESKFNNNKVTTSKNATKKNYGGGAIYSDGQLSIDKTEFDSNIAPYDDSGTEQDAGRGGAIFVYDFINEISITNSNFTANEAGRGGAIYVYYTQYDEENALIDSNNFIKNLAYRGGAILLVHSVTVTNNNFTENMLNNKNINIYPVGAVIDFDSNKKDKPYTLTLSDNTFKDNNAGQGYGGTITLTEDTILNSKNNIYENNKAAFGGAILNYGNATLTNDTFTNNTALYNGGAINSQGTLTVTISKFNNNKVTTSKNTADNAYGGGAISSGGPLSIDRTEFNSNIAAHDDSGTNRDAGVGGSIFVYNLINETRITNSNFTANEAGHGGAIYNFGDTTLINDTFTNNTALYRGGAINSPGTLTVTESKFNNNKVTTSKNATKKNYGGGAILSRGPLTIDKSLFTGNTAPCDDSGTEQDLGPGGAVYVFNCTDDVIISNSNFTANEAGQGGAIEIYDPQNRDEGNILIDSNNFQNNSALHGGAILLIHSATINNNNFTENMLNDKNTDISIGAAIEFFDEECDKSYMLTLLANTFRDNNAGQGYGGAIFISEGVILDSKNNIYENNKAAFGGAIYNEGNATLTNTTFTNNTALYNGGAIGSSGTLIITISKFNNNKVTTSKNAADNAYGGGAISSGGLLSIDKTEFRGNIASYDDSGTDRDAGVGGALFVYDFITEVSITNSKFTDNEAGHGGAIYNFGDTTLINDTFTNNTALYRGGAINSPGTLTVTESRFNNNKVTTSKNARTKDYGGGAILSRGPLTIDKSLFTGNTAAHDDSGTNLNAGPGGAIYIFNSTDDVSITNSNFTANEAGGGGALAIYDPQNRDEGNILIDSNNFTENIANQAGTISLTHSATITNNNFTENMINNKNINIASYGAVINFYNEKNDKTFTLTLSDNTFKDNNAGRGSGGAIFIAKGMIMDSKNNTYKNNKADIGGAIFNFGNATFNDDVFIQNSAKISAVFLNLDELIINNCSFIDNKATEREDLFSTFNNVLIRNSTINTDNLEKLVKTFDDAEIFAYENVVNNEFLEEGLINSTLTLTLDDKDLILNKQNIINGTLIDATDVPIFNKTVELYVDGEMVDIAVTDENGIFTFNYIPTGGSNASIQVVFNPEDYYLSSASKAVVVNIVENETPVPVPPQPKPPVPVHPKVKLINKVANVQNNKDMQVKTHTIRLASDNRIVFTANALTLEGLGKIFDMNFTNGHLIVYMDGIIVFNGTTSNDITLIIIELLDKFLGEHEIKVVFTDGQNNTNTYKENIIIE